MFLKTKKSQRCFVFLLLVTLDLQIQKFRPLYVYCQLVRSDHFSPLDILVCTKDLILDLSTNYVVTFAPLHFL